MHEYARSLAGTSLRYSDTRLIVNLPTVFGQLATFTAYAIVAKVQGSDGLSVPQAVTSLSLINLIINPLSSLLLAIPDTFASMGCLDRIQEFLRHTKHLGKSLMLPHSFYHLLFNGFFLRFRSPYFRANVTHAVLHTEKRGFPQSALESSISARNTSDSALGSIQGPVETNHTVMSLQNVRFSWNSSPSDRAGTTLKIDSCPMGTLVLVVGSVGSGKSTFLKGIAGETPMMEGDYFVKYPDLAFCDQTPWLVNASIKENIVGNSICALDHEWYRTVIDACSLDTDFIRMPEGDQTLVGSQGAKLSGGQKQRIVSGSFILYQYDSMGIYANQPALS